MRWNLDCRINGDKEKRVKGEQVRRRRKEETGGC